MNCAVNQTPFDLLPAACAQSLPVVNEPVPAITPDPAEQFREACRAWLSKSPSRDTRVNYAHDLKEFMAFVGIAADHSERLTTVRPHQVAAWRDRLREAGLTNSSIRRKMTVLRSLCSYLQTYGYMGVNPTNPARTSLLDFYEI
jgi:site-specific recombinase XerD